MFNRDDFVGYDILNISEEYDSDTVLEIYIIMKEPNFIHMKNLYKHSKLFNYRLFELYTENNKFTYYAMRSIDVKTHFGNFIKTQYSIEAFYEDEPNECVIIDDIFFNQIYNIKNSGAKATILQLCLFPDDNSILEKCRKKVGFYMVAKISINLANKCIIYPEHNITDYRVDNMFIIKSFDSYIPNICLEIDDRVRVARDRLSFEMQNSTENNHSDRNQNEEIARENFIRTFGHKIIRVSVRRNESNEEVDKLIIKTTKDIELLIEDLITEYSIQNISENDFINKVSNDMTIEKEFAIMFVRKNDDNFEHFKYKHTEIASFLGYENIDNYKHFLNMMKKELRYEVDYISTINHLDDLRTTNISHPQKIPLEDVKKCGKRITYMISRIGFYILCLMANKPSAKIYRRQFGELYEFSINYVNSLKKKVIENIQPSNVSEKAVSDRLNYKTESIVKNKSISKLESENEKLKNEIFKLQEEIKLLTQEKNKFKSNADYYMKQSINKQSNKNFIKLQNFKIDNFIKNYLPRLLSNLIINK